MQPPTTETLSQPEPEKTGVDPAQSGELVVLPPSEPKVYAMSETLTALASTGIVPAAVQILATHEANSEERFKNVDAERRKTLDDLKTMTDAYHEQKILVTRYASRMSDGYIGSLGQNVMITIGATCLGAGIPEILRPDASSIGTILLIVGALLLGTGWTLAIVAHTRNRDMS